MDITNRSEELSVFDTQATTNKAPESYHAKLRAIVKTSHPRIWNFLSALNTIIEETDNDIYRLRLDKIISRPKKRKYMLKSKQREDYMQKFQYGIFTPLRYLAAINKTIGTSNIVSLEPQLLDISDQDEDDHRGGGEMAANPGNLYNMPETSHRNVGIYALQKRNLLHNLQ